MRKYVAIVSLNQMNQNAQEFVNDKNPGTNYI